MSDEGLRAAAAWILERPRMLIASHRDPDGDSLGSSLALALGLDALGKESVVMLGQRLPDVFEWLPGAARIQTVESAPVGYPGCVHIECSDFARCGIPGVETVPSLNIDHHSKNSNFADVNWIDDSVAAAGMMVRDLLLALDQEITPEIATLLYVTVFTDTGSFRHANSDAGALRFCSEMVEAGADAGDIAERVYGSYPARRVFLLGEALQTLKLLDKGRIAVMHIPSSAFRRHRSRDTEGVINQAQGIAGVQASILLKEVEPDRYRISMRSDGSVDVAAIAAEIGGGGHPRAAGCSLDGELQLVREDIVERVRAGMRRQVIS